MDAPAPCGERPGLHGAGVDGGTLAHAVEPEAVRALGGGAYGRAGVADLDVDARAVVTQSHERLRAGACVLERVGERLLHDAEDGQLRSGGKLAHVAFHRDLHGQPGRAHLPDEHVDLMQARLRHEPALALAVPEHAEQAAHLAERLSPGCGDRLHGGDRLLGESSAAKAAPSASAIITLRLCATMSCISRAMRARSAAAARSSSDAW